MPNATNNRRDEQWDLCQRCGFQFPMSQLTVQHGLLVCHRTCVDNLLVEDREKKISQILGLDIDTEGSDRRWVDRAFFPGQDEDAEV